MYPFKNKTVFNSNGQVIEEWVEKVACIDCKQYIPDAFYKNKFICSSTLLNVTATDFCSKHYIPKEQ
jgi:hypothetical protein